MKVLIFSSLELPYTKVARFTGLERIAVNFANELNRTGHNVTICAHKDTWVDEGVKLLPCEGYEGHDYIHAEIRAYQQYQALFRDYDVIHDIGHLHLIARFMSNLPTINVLNHAPVHAQYPKAPYNIVSWSRWGVWAFRRYYKQDARYQETIAIPPEQYFPASQKRGDRYLTIGRMSQDKGNLNAAMLCQQLGVPLDIVGGRGSEHRGDELTEYEQQCRQIADGTNIKFLGEVDDAEKITLMQSCKALIYATNHTEITSHKVQECMFCGAPVILPNLGGLPEICTHGVDGFVCNNEAEYLVAISNVHNLSPEKTHEQVVAKYCTKNVVANYVKLYQEVANGLRWK